jgi:hypothetical protein
MWVWYGGESSFVSQLFRVVILLVALLVDPNADSWGSHDKGRLGLDGIVLFEPDMPVVACGGMVQCKALLVSSGLIKPARTNPAEPGAGLI